MNARFLALAALAILNLSAATAASAQTVINSVPYTINVSGKYVLGANLATNTANQSAITISVSNVILDLNGFFVSGPGNATVSTVPVIGITNGSNVTIRNGTVANNAYGIYFYGSAPTGNFVVENVNVTKCFYIGVYFLAAAPGSQVRNNSISNIGSTGGGNNAAYGIVTAGGVSIENNLISTVTPEGATVSYGIFAGGTDFAVGNKISSCSIGIQMATGGKYLNNLTSNCPTPFAGGGTNATGNN